MKKKNVARGIDLGTTNSEIAELRGDTIHIFANSEKPSQDYTPSAVWLDASNRLVVGRAAKERFESNPENAAVEFKLTMGSGTTYTFARDGRVITPVELSAEILKSLRSDVQRDYKDDVTKGIVSSAVITIPADFGAPQRKATVEAAELAGITNVMLLIEPIAAALAYGFDGAVGDSLWLIYDLGGGTFDAAVIQVRDGMLDVLGHAGNKHLGGKNIDWAVVEGNFIPALICSRVKGVFRSPAELLSDPDWADLLSGAPELKARFKREPWDNALVAECYHYESIWNLLSKAAGLTGIRRGHPTWRRAMANLKIQAESAKIKLSKEEKTKIEIDFLCNDDSGQPIGFEHVLTRADQERFSAPFIQSTINLCKEALTQLKLAPSSVSKCVLVGGPTMMPILRQMLAHPTDGIGIPLEHGVDPLTVVARGAAVFAASQFVDPDGGRSGDGGDEGYRLKLDYRPLSQDLTPDVAGTILAGAGGVATFQGFSVEIQNPGAKPPWRSGKIPVFPAGNFMTQVILAPATLNRLEIEVFDPTGTLIPVGHGTLEINTRVIDTPEPQLTHSIGLALSNNGVRPYFRKGAVLPVRKEDKGLHTTVLLQKGQSGQLLAIPVVEGEKNRSDRNRLVGSLSIPADSDKIIRDVPIGSEVHVTLMVDKKGTITASAYIPHLDDDFECSIPVVDYTPGAPELQELFKSASTRLEQVRKRAETLQEPAALEALARINNERMVEEIGKLTTTAVNDDDAARECLNLLHLLESCLDDAEEALEWPEVVAKGRAERQNVENICQLFDVTTDADRAILALLGKQLDEAISKHDADLVRRRHQALEGLGAKIVLRDPRPWIAKLEELEARKDKFTSSSAWKAEIKKGRTAITEENRGVLESAVRALLDLVPQCEGDFIRIKEGVRLWSDPARAAKLLAEGDKSLESGDHGRLDAIVAELSSLQSGVVAE